MEIARAYKLTGQDNSDDSQLKRIIIVDDSELLRARIKSLIGSIPNTEVIAEADNGIDAINIISKQNPDFVILDINMPGKSGIEVLKMLQQTNSKANVIVLTNHTEDIYRKNCLKLGASHFLDKTNQFYLLPEIIN